jgi:hypothetical protein
MLTIINGTSIIAKHKHKPFNSQIKVIGESDASIISIIGSTGTLSFENKELINVSFWNLEASRNTENYL